MTQVTYTLDMTPANAEKIDQINRIVLGESYLASVQPPLTDSQKMSAQTVNKPVKETKVEKTKVEETKVEEPAGTTIDDVKKAAKKAKSDHGEEFTMQVLKDSGVDVAATLGRSMAKIPKEAYDTIIGLWEFGPQVVEQTADEPEDAWDEEEEDTSEVTVEAVTTALKAYSKEKGRDIAKKIMNDNGAKLLSNVAECTPAQLQAMFKALI